MWTPLANFLMRSGYRETREGGRYKTVEVYSYQKGDQKVQVMGRYLDPVEAIHDFHSSVVMNFMTCDFAYCIFPKRTLVRKEAQVRTARLLTEIDERSTEKYEKRGWTVVQWIRQKRDEEYGIHTARTVKDRHTLKVRLYDNVIGGESRGGNHKISFTD